MPWPGAPLRIALLLLAATVGPPGILSEENVGCLFSERLCLEDEWCFDDYAFGRCLQATGDVDEDDLYRYNLERELLHEISRELRRLFALGYRWSHAYTQCRLQAMLYATKHDVSFENNACSHLVDQDLEGALKALEGQDPLDPQEMAIVKYTPSIENPHADFADEVYYPPVDDSPRQALREKILAANAVDLFDMEDPYAQYEVMKRTWIPQMHRRSLPPKFFNENYDIPNNVRSGMEARDELEFLPQINGDEEELTLQNLRELYPLIKYLNQMKWSKEEIQETLPPEDYVKLRKLLTQFEEANNLKQELEAAQEQLNVPAERFTLTYNTPDSFRAGWESKDTLPYNNDFPEPRIYFDENDESEEEYGSGINSVPGGIFREMNNRYDYEGDGNFNTQEVLSELKSEFPQQHPSIYTEGGVVYDSESQANNYEVPQVLNDARINLDKLLTKYNLGFKRPERLDVKKPGPPFDAQITDGKRAVPNRHQKHNKDNLALPTTTKENIESNNVEPVQGLYVPDMDYVYVKFKNNVYSWAQGNQIIGNISHLLQLERTAFTHGRVDRNEVTFRVEPNTKLYNATTVVHKIESIRDELQRTTGIEITAAGIGDRTKMESIISSPINDNQFYIVIFMVCGVLGAMIIAASLLILIKKHLKAREKLQGLSRPDTEASKDYQDLCRARMAAKGQQAGETVHGRITSLSRESEQSPSSRSSTSSWSEEPALHNMDISTGHMVLSYMEDHLKNKDRLEQEWVALCAYVAEPCETSIALKKENTEKNRYPDIVPYDHARVVLNELSNISGFDYINASSITDHDPRNPAYIATQGPLPHTAPDFWQLIWEQGAVVIVMLTRLTEGGAAMCHRYWPEEGSELYHIYEVHLVSEHIWCDDYLVRSFYLKNVRTGETRTVTQFHFLSWPESGVPASTKALLEFRRKVNKSYRGRSCPIVVHCSDGAGRTGTYCLIDMVLSRMAKGAKEIDIAATLEHLRDQRPRMVATKQQFEFVLTAVAEEVHAILKALPPQPTPAQADKEKQ